VAWFTHKRGATPRQRRWSRVTVVAIGAFAVAGCSSSTTGKTGATATSSTSTTSSSPSSSSGSSPPVYEVTTGRVKGLGKVLVDGQGLTLYLFVPDKQSGISTCYGKCAQAWPPLLLPAGVTAPLAGAGIKNGLLGTTHRTDGTIQVTYNKWPLYLWVIDSAPGDATGQGINNNGGLWFVLSPDGATITKR
jgi:predicted lipoprotein with Yx(FWY)xxD motif